ncbi:MAG TPA: branched-chain amino acid ABC transporter permease [Candidatus Limnocylindria bacterium]|nr:branched-chain amino acid ABC transporter permease [Candidatus Limnocylindria bacterium]
MKIARGSAVRFLAVLVALSAYALLPFGLSSYMQRVFNVMMITFLCVLSVYVLLGMCGQNSFAQAGLWGVGAYMTANFTMKLGIGSLPALLLSVLGTALLAFVLGFSFFRLRRYYFTFASVGLMTILNGLFMNWEPVTGGAMGYRDIATFSLLGFRANTEIAKFYVILLVCVAAGALMNVLSKSALGRSFMAIRDDEMAANSMGVNSLLTKSVAFAISGALCGAAGSLYAFVAGYLSYQSFTFQQSTMYLIMVMLGGTYSWTGSIIGTMIISLLQEFVRPLQNFMLLIYGVGIMLMMVFQPEGLLGGGKALYDLIAKRRKARPVAE